MGNTNPASGNPRAFGDVNVTTGGTPVRATSGQTDPTLRIGLQSITFQVKPGNTGVMYIRAKGPGTPTDDRTNLDFTMRVLPAPPSATQGPFAETTFTALPGSGGLNLADFWIDAGVNGNGVLISGIAG